MPNTAPIDWPRHPFASGVRVQQAVYDVLTNPVYNLTVWGNPSEGGPDLPPNPNDLPYVLNRDPITAPANIGPFSCKPDYTNITVTLNVFSQRRTDEIAYLDAITEALTGGGADEGAGFRDALALHEMYIARCNGAPSVFDGPQDDTSRREALFHKIWELDYEMVPLTDELIELNTPCFN